MGERLRFEAVRLVRLVRAGEVCWRAEARRWWWWRFVRRHEYEICGACGRPVMRSSGPTWWEAPDALWRDVEGGDGGIRCMPCFAADVEAAGGRMHWCAVGLGPTAIREMESVPLGRRALPFGRHAEV